MDDELRERVRAWDALPGGLADANYVGFPHPLDAKFDALCALYLGASPAQRRQHVALVVSAEAGGHDVVVAEANLLTYIRRCGRRMIGPNDVNLLRRGMTAAGLAGEHVDARDLAVALVFLRAGATRAGISPPVALHVLGETLPGPPPSDDSDIARGERAARQVILAVFRSDEATITRILAYHAGTG